MRCPLSVVAAALVAVTISCTGRPPEDATGAEIYAQLCANCHGDDMSGGIGTALGPGSPAAGETDDFLEFTILRGRGRMPSFSRSLDDHQLDRLIEHIREVQAGG